MISKYMRGRLGNQMFQYAMIREIQEKNGNTDKIYLNFSKYIKSKNFEDELKYFKVKEYEEVEKIQLSLIQKFLILYYKIRKRIIRFVDPKNYYKKRHILEDKIKDNLIKKGIYWMEDGYLKTTKTKTKNKIVIGHFESSKNFNDIKNKLIKEFEPKSPCLDKNKKIYKLINSTNSVCITVRRGDFVTNKKFSERFNVCDLNYFLKSIEIMKEKINNPTFFIFSDDIEWCKQNIKMDSNVYYEGGNDPVWEKLRLMYSCKHFIISNSTFSWWAQYLSRNNKKVVIAPKKWQKYGYNDDIYEENWILI